MNPDDENDALWLHNGAFSEFDLSPTDLLEHQWVDAITRKRAEPTGDSPVCERISDWKLNPIGTMFLYRVKRLYDADMAGVVCGHADKRWHCAVWTTAVNRFVMASIWPKWVDPDSYPNVSGDPAVVIVVGDYSVRFVWESSDYHQQNSMVLVVPSLFGGECGECIGCRSVPESHEVVSSDWVYFLRAKDNRHVKIGHSSRPYGRMGSLQTGNSSPLEMLAIMPGGYVVERSLHTLFAKDRVRPGGEWFHPSTALMAFIREVGGGSNA
jgi:hypothetical protein